MASFSHGWKPMAGCLSNVLRRSLALNCLSPRSAPLLYASSKEFIPGFVSAPISSHCWSTRILCREDQGTVLVPSETVDLPIPSTIFDASTDSHSGSDLTPSRVVELLDQHIVGQSEAKRAVAVALRNRWRRHRITSSLREEIVPKNILMIGPTGCGKTEIARRLAKLADSPFVKVEATKFTEVGFHGRDVDQIIRDLVDNAITLQKQKIKSKVSKDVEEFVENQILDLLVGSSKEVDSGGETAPDRHKVREAMRTLYRNGALDRRKVQITVPENKTIRFPIDTIGSGLALNDLVFKIEKVLKGPKTDRKELTVSEARSLLIELEIEKHTSSDQITKDAIQLAESDGIVFIDEIDKIVTTAETRMGADASSEGVQRDLLPIIEGSVVSTKYGNVNTDHILFICSGAFHSCKPSDMLAELQGRLPIRVELKGLTQEDLYRILTEPKANMIIQQKELLKTENIELEFTEGAIKEIASMAFEVNKLVDNIGARRLHTVIEKVVEDISFYAPERSGQKWVINEQTVQNTVGGLLERTDISRFVL